MDERIKSLYRLILSPDAESHWRVIVERAKSLAGDSRALGSPLPKWVVGLARENAHHPEIARERILKARQEAEAEAWGFPPTDEQVLEAYTRSRWLLEVFQAEVSTPFGPRLACLVCAGGRLAIACHEDFWPASDDDDAGRADTRIAREAAYLVADFPGLPAGEAFYLKSIEAHGATAIGSSGTAYSLSSDGIWEAIGEAEPPELLAETLAAAADAPYSERFYSRALNGVAGYMGLRVIALRSGHLFYSGLWPLYGQVSLDAVRARKLETLALQPGLRPHPEPPTYPGLPTGELLLVADAPWLANPMARVIGKEERFRLIPYRGR